MTGRRVHLGGLGPAAPTTREFAAFFAKWAGTSAVHRIVADPAEADLLLFIHGTDLRAPLTPQEKDLLARRGDDCFALDGLDRPVGFLPGLYAAIPAPRFDPARFRTYCYPVENRQIEEAVRAMVPKAWFFSFLGGASSPLRRRIYGLRHGRADVVIEDTTAHQEWNPHQPAWAERKRRYAEVLAGSELCLCPRGAGVGSIRLFEAMQAGAVPVLIADDYVLPVGPDWDQFLIRLPESALAGVGGDLPRLLEPWRERSREMGLLARRAWEEWFAPAVWLDRIVENVEALRAARRMPEARARRKWPYWKLRRYLRERPAAALRAVRNRIRR